MNSKASNVTNGTGPKAGDLAKYALAALVAVAGVEMVMPGDNIQMTIELNIPVAMDEGLRFAIREGGRTVGAGVVTEVIK